MTNQQIRNKKAGKMIFVSGKIIPLFLTTKYQIELNWESVIDIAIIIQIEDEP